MQAGPLTSRQHRRLCRLAAFVFVSLFFIAGSSLAANSYAVGNSATVTVDEHGVCKKITNNHASGASIMVPTKSASEWHTGGSSFLQNLPAGVSSADCAPPCPTGTVVGPHCWFAGGTLQNCDTVCGGQGMVCDLVGIRDYAGSNGSNANCDAVLTAVLSTSLTVTDTGAGGAWGCGWVGASYQRDIGATTTCAASNLLQRACACQ